MKIDHDNVVVYAVKALTSEELSVIGSCLKHAINSRHFAFPQDKIIAERLWDAIDVKFKEVAK